MQRLAWRVAACICVKDFFNRGQTLTLDRDFFGRCECGFQRNTKGFTAKCLQFLAKDDGIGSARFDEFQFRRCERPR